MDCFRNIISCIVLTSGYPKTCLENEEFLIILGNCKKEGGYKSISDLDFVPYIFTEGKFEPADFLNGVPKH